MDAGDVIYVLLQLGLILFLVLLNGFFVAAEFAVVKIRQTQLQPLIDQGHRRAHIARRIVGNLDASLSATQLGITLASLGLGWYAEPVFASLLEPALHWFQVYSEQAQHAIAFGIGFSVITFLHIVVGELAPKSLAIQKPLATTLWISVPLEWFYKISYPFIWLLNHAAMWLLRRVGIEPVAESELTHSEEELRLLVSTAQKEAGGTALGRAIVLNAMDLRRRIAREVMRPRNEIEYLDSKWSIKECLELAEKTRFSRFPLCEEGDLDRTLGVVHVKDLMALRRSAGKASELAGTARKIIYVPEISRLEKLLQLLLDRKLHLAIVVDEYGSTVGMVTLENILEELVGQIQDEFDQEPPLLVKVTDSSWEVAGALPLHELEELVGRTLKEEGVSTTSGWVTHQLGGFPKVGNTLSIGPYTLRVEELEGMLVKRLNLEKKPAQGNQSR